MIHRWSTCLFGIIILSSPLGCADHTEPLEQSLTSPPLNFRQMGVTYEQTDGELSVIVNDRLDRKVCVTNVPQRIISLSPSTTELLFAIGAGSRVVGVTQHCNYPRAAAELPRVGGGTLESLSREKILTLAPDLVLCKWDNHEPLINVLERFDIPVLAFGPETLEELYNEASVLGRVTRCEANAERLIAEMKGRVDSLTSLVSSVPLERRRSVFYEVWDDPLMSAGPTSFIGELLQLAGTENVFSDTSIRYPRVSAEVVVSRNPDVILSPTTHATAVSREKILQRQGWSQVTAVRDEQVYLIDGDQVSRCGPRLIDALEDIIRVVYPEQYRAADQLMPTAMEDAIR